MKKHCLILDLKDDPKVIEAYDEYHRNVWPEILDSIHDSGILSMEIYRAANRLMMFLEVSDDFSFRRKQEMDLANPKVVEWETLMSKYQKTLDFAEEGQKWVLAKKVFETRR